ncbi:Clp amino terminal domain-containing protein, pathogenicity island component [Amycolatopsis xylanica]|uniref:Clp amino terminal domain-containing protein, pathogenicity island component n=1 Tax=Amycolatopsis xylanica TaxID=589385 RepID=A0A1H3T423_9PSEU|nr:Clp protease N-terminal domain-containing protein [Amycolatopsis xylanica]SDZ44109.1 Clp amino terminal domain-containing protein, pathogenicity island component [Amycolatopsis xylanica]
MFERFTTGAREAVVDAQRVAVESGAKQIDPMHLLAVVAVTPSGRTLLGGLGVVPEDLASEVNRIRRRGGMSDADAEALSEFGIDVEQIIAKVEQMHGPGALSPPHGRLTRRDRRSRLPFARESKKTLEKTLHEALAMGDKHIGEEHMLLALAALPGPASDVLAQRDVTYLALRQALTKAS